MTTPSPPSDAATLATASSLVVLLSSTYSSLDALPAGGVAAPAALDAHIADALVALRRARADLADAARTASGRPASTAEPPQAATVAAALPTVRTAGDVVALALTLEDVLAQTLVADVGLLTAPALRSLCGGLGAEAAARAGRLLILASLLASGRTALAAPAPDLAALPPSAGTVGFPDTRFPTEKAVRTGGPS